MTFSTPLLLLPILLLLQPSARPVPGGILNLAAAENCTADYIVSLPEGSTKINETQKVGQGRRSIHTYIHYEDGFKGVELVAVVGGDHYRAWVPLKNTCFPITNGTWWWTVLGVAWIEKDTTTTTNNNNNKNSNNNSSLRLRFTTVNCYAECLQSVPGNETTELYIMAKGPSQWRVNRTWEASCPTEERLKDDTPKLDCTLKTISPHLRTSTTTKNPAKAPAGNTDYVSPTPSAGDTENGTSEVVVIVAVVVGVVVLVLVVVGVVVAVKWNRQRRDVVMQPSQDTPTNSKEVVVVENSLYEPVENFQRPQPTQE